MSKTTRKFSPEVRERAVRMVGEHRADYGSEWETMTSIAAKIGCTAETLRRWCREEALRRAGPAAQAADDQARLKLLEREVKELRRANEILRKASAYFAQAELVLSVPWLLRQKRAAAQHRKLRGSGGGRRRAELGLAGPWSSLAIPRLF